MKMAVLGAGSWGTALSLHLKRSGHLVTLWSHNPEKALELGRIRENKTLLPGILLPEDIKVTSDMAEALKGKEAVVFAVPSHAIRAACAAAAEVWPSGAWAVSASKGLEESTSLRISEVLKQTLKNETPIAVLSGPSHAEEVSRKMPTTLVAASPDAEISRKVQDAFHSDYLRVYTSPDLPGVEWGGALKNVIAIAAGITDGLGLGDNAKAALMTRGLHEMTRLGVALGAQAPTFSGLAGMGDLFVTCTSRHSRNRLLGEKIGKGAPPQRALTEMIMVAEGVKTAPAVLGLARKSGVEVPIASEVHQVLFLRKSASEAAKSLLSRTAKSEQDGQVFESPRA
jgi:glycerol-3-phosphate dehydrogenase (NAD(P)+)